MKIRTRFLVSFLSFYFLILAVAILSQFYSFRLFSSYLYGSVNEIFHASVGSFTKSIKNMEQLSVTIMSDNSTQEFLSGNNENLNNFLWMRKREEFIEKLRFYTITNPYMKEIIIESGNGSSYHANKGAYDRAFSSVEEKERIAIETLNKKGSYQWSVSESPLSPLILSRQINLVGDFTHQPMGNLYCFVDIEKIIEENLRQVKYYGLKSSIYYEGKLLYSAIGQEISDKIKSEVAPLRHRNIRYHGKAYFATVAKTEDKDWDFLFLIPTEELFEDFNRINRLSYIIYFTLFLLFTFMMVRSTNRLTAPIISLSKEMQLMEERDFVSGEPTALPGGTSDEVSLLHYEFYQMAGRIDNLVNKNLKQELSLNKSQLEVLSHQLNPHFLYNTLDSIYWMAEISKQPEMAGMVKSLSSLLRNSLNKSTPLISVKEQLDILNDYFYIQKARFKDRLDYAIDVDFTLYNEQIPRFTLQPLVENSIKYSLDKSNSSCLIEISIKKSESQEGMDILIRDNGPGFAESDDDREKTGIGLANLKQRISLIYGDSGFMKNERNQAGGTDIILFIPLRKKEYL